MVIPFKYVIFDFIITVLQQSVKLSRNVFITVTLVFILLSWFYQYQTAPRNQANRFQKQLEAKHQAFSGWINQLTDTLKFENLNGLFKNDQLTHEIDENAYRLYVYQSGKLAFWSDANTIIDTKSNKKGYVQLNNGWYYFEEFWKENLKIFGLFQISESYATQNKYLTPNVLLKGDFLNGIQISKEKCETCYEINTTNNVPLYLNFSEVKMGSSFFNTLLVLVFYVWFLLILVYVFQLWKGISKRKTKILSAILIVVVLTGLRLVWINNPFPNFIYQNPIFSPRVYAQSAVFPSLGDLVINVSILLFFVFILTGLISGLKPPVESRKSASIWVILLVVNLGIVFGINQLFEGLIKNSRIPFNLDHLFELGIFSLAGMLALGLVFMAYYSLMLGFVKLVHRSRLSLSLFTLLAFTLYALFATILSGWSDYDLIDSVWSLPVILTIGIWVWFNDKIFYFGISLLNIALFAFFTSHVFNKYNTQKEFSIREILGDRIQRVQDPILELDFSDQSSTLQNDAWVKERVRLNFLSDENQTVLSQKFGSDWYRFKKRFTVSPYTESLTHFNDLAALNRIDSLAPTNSDNLYFFYSDTLGMGYLFSLPFIEVGDTIGYLNGLFSEIPEPDQIGFPGLLSDDRITLSESDEYVYARYKNNTRILSNFENGFPLDLTKWELGLKDRGFIQRNGLSILVLPQNYGFRWMIAKRVTDFWQHITIFSYLFLFFGILYSIWLVLERLLTQPRPLNLSLRTKIQIILIGFILVLLTIYAIVVFAQINDQFNRQNRDQISERLNSINIELQHKIGRTDSLESLGEPWLNNYLEKFSEVFYSDISVFNLSGTLMASSSAIIWEKSLLSRRIHPDAFLEMEILDKNRFIHEESIGSFSYLSGYKPLINENGKHLGILNVPYFTKQDDYKREVNRFLLVLINMFVLLTGISVIVAIYVSNWITSPLKILQNSFTQLDLIRVNQPVEYKGTDEVAAIVKVYNSKVRELEKMATRIAQSERESAWREMARQVAHEIKNPLTPMRLSIQHYLRVLKDNPKEANQRSETLLNSLIEQIDNLSHIANEFSQFAKISISTNSQFDLKDQIEEIVSLFAAIEHIHFVTDITLKEAPITADKGQIIRLLNNLIKNAIQAIGQRKNGEITISLKVSQKVYTMIISDNGSGIRNDLHGRIFKPNFTTKSKGMGLGLAIVKKIVDNHKGSISFQTELNKGTSFIILIPNGD